MIHYLAGQRHARRLALVALLGIPVAVVATIVGHLDLGPGFDPLALTISDFAVSDHGGAITVAMVTLGIASLVLLAGLLAVRAPVRGWPAALLLGWSAGLFIAAAVPTDPMDAPAVSLSGYVHRYASVGAFLCLPAGAWRLASRLDADARWHHVPGRIRWLAVATGVCLLAMYYVAFPGDRVLIGLVERVLLAVEVALLAVLAARLYRVADPAESIAVPAEPVPSSTRVHRYGEASDSHVAQGLLCGSRRRRAGLVGTRTRQGAADRHAPLTVFEPCRCPLDR